MNDAFKYRRVVFAAFTAIVLGGCKGTIMPRLEGPGSAGYQRSNALQYDPYPLDDVAPPVAGGRPKEYDRPIPEVTRGKLFNFARPGEQPSAVPLFGPAVAPPITAPPAMPSAMVSPFTPPANVPYQVPPVAQPVVQPFPSQPPMPQPSVL